MNEAEPEQCPNCGTPTVDGWVIYTGVPKEGAILTSDHVCPDCGAPFCDDDDDEDNPS